jgi:hypothetical protein
VAHFLFVEVSADTAVTRHGREILSVFDLLGRQENDLTAALAFALGRSPELLGRVLARVLPAASGTGVSVRMEVRDVVGRTDLEIDTGSHLVVIEAKRGWFLPGEKQLAEYAPRILERGAGVLVTLSDASDTWAASALPGSVKGVPVSHLSWTAVRQDLNVVRSDTRGRERLWLDELHHYLRRAIKVLDPADSWTYCVSVSNGRPGDGGSRTFLDFVIQEACYFHPFGSGGGWPKTPPNFLAFRWGAHVQQVRRVVGHKVEHNLQARWADIPVTPETDRPHLVYELGPTLLPAPVPSGKQYRANRLWVLLDQLLTGPTLAEAIASTKSITEP